MSNIGHWNGLNTTITRGDGGHPVLHLPLNPTSSLLLFFTKKTNSLNPSNPLSTHLLLQKKQQQPLHLCCSRSSSKWDTNAESIKNQSFSDLGDFEDEEEELDGDGVLDQGAQVFEEYIESIWILKVFWSYGWAFPPILIGLLITGGPKAFLMALALPLGQSTFSFAIQKMLDATQNKPPRKTRTKKRQRAAPTSSKPNFWRRGGIPRKRKRKTGYQSWVSNNDVSASKDEREVSRYGGWDELDQEMESSKGSFESPTQSSAETSKIPVENDNDQMISTRSKTKAEVLSGLKNHNSCQNRHHVKCKTFPKSVQDSHHTSVNKGTKVTDDGKLDPQTRARLVKADPSRRTPSK